MKNDSNKLNHLIAASELYQDNYTKEYQLINEEICKLSYHLKHPRGNVLGYKNLGKYYIQNNLLDTALIKIQIGINRSKSFKYYDLLLDLYEIEIFIHQSRYDELHELNSCLHLRNTGRELQLPNLEINGAILLAQFYASRKNYFKALAETKEIKIPHENSDSLKLKTHQLQAYYLFKLGRYDKADSILMPMYNNLNQYPPNKRVNIILDLCRNNNALGLFSKTINILHPNFQTYNIDKKITAYNLLVIAFCNSNQKAKAFETLNHLNKITTSFPELVDHISIVEANLIFYKTFENCDSLNLYQKHFWTLKNNLFNQELDSLEIALKHNINRIKQQNIDQKSKEIEKTRAKKISNYSMFLFIALFSSLVFIILKLYFTDKFNPLEIFALLTIMVSFSICLILIK